MVIELFWSLHNGKHFLHMGMLDSHGRDDNILGVKFILGNIIPENITSNFLPNIEMFSHFQENKKMHVYQMDRRKILNLLEIRKTLFYFILFIILNFNYFIKR